MHDEEASAHQFSVREISVQADEEEKLELEMQISRLNAAIENTDDARSRLSMTKSHRSVINMSPTRKKEKKGGLLPRDHTKSEMGI